MWRRYLLMSITHFWLMQVTSLTDSKDSDEAATKQDSEDPCQKAPIKDLVDCDTTDTRKYGDPEVTRMCKRSKAVKEIRNECMTDKQCLDNAQSQCDNDPNCFGVSWLPYSKTEDLKLCLSKEMAPKTDGWRTMMKSEGNKTCRRFVAILDESVAVTPPRNPAFKFVKVFNYIGTRIGWGTGDVFLSTNTEGNDESNPILVFNFANSVEPNEAVDKKLGWVGSEVKRDLDIPDKLIWTDLLYDYKLFDTGDDDTCREYYIEKCTRGKWKTKRVKNERKELMLDPGLSFECERPPTWSDWETTSDCMPSNPKKGCGDGNTKQKRTCTNGNIDNCKDTFEERQEPCEIPCTIRGAAITTKVSLPAETKGIGFETTDTTRKKDDKKITWKTVGSDPWVFGFAVKKQVEGYTMLLSLALVFFQF